MSTITIEELTMDYEKNRALVHITLTIEPNKIYGLLGRNGAGKTTLLNLLTNRIFPTSGEIKIDGKNVIENEQALSQIYYMMEANYFPESLKVKDVFRWTKEFYPLFDTAYANELANKFNLNIQKKIKSLSTGYHSIFKAILALASNAKILIFDEPVLGLDAYHRDLFYKELIVVYSENPKTIIISTHLIEEIADVLEEVIVIHEGRIIANHSVEELLASAYQVSGEAEKVDQYMIGKQAAGQKMMGKYKMVTVLKKISKENEEVASELGLSFSKPELQELFIHMTNGQEV